MKLIWQCLSSPRLFKIYGDGPRDAMYTPQGIEHFADKIITSINALSNVCFYTSPFICMFLYKRGLNYDDFKFIGILCTSLGCLIASAFVLRAYGRSSNSKYVQFLNALNRPMNNKTDYLKGIRKYDFDFTAWPVTFAVSSKERSSLLWTNPFTKSSISDLPIYQRIPLQVLAFIATHTFGLRLIYPGSLTLVQNLFWSPIFQGRSELVEILDGKRAKLLTADGNTIDSMYVENKAPTHTAKTLVICCEGNSGFYELGIMTTPIKAGYSALGWNHPGFAGSTGKPYPNQEHNAIDAVMQYAINELGYQPRDIVLFGWSIGGYSATWAAVNYPIKALVLDATFDDLLALAQNHVPSSWSTLVKEVVRSYVNLDIADLIAQYDGPVQLIRRTEDEIICLVPGHMATNCGNKLLLKLIQQRHFTLFDEFPKLTETLEKYVRLSDSQRNNIDNSSLDETKKIALSLISKYLKDYNSSHCTPLPENLFKTIMETMSLIPRLKQNSKI